MTVAAPQPHAPDSAPRRPVSAGRGELHCIAHRHRTVITRLFAASPLRLLHPANSGPAAWVCASTFGGGLVSGDSIDLHLTCGPRAACYFSTQSATKVFRSTGPLTRQSLTARLEDQALLIVAPDPVMVFAGARYHQHQTFDLPASAGLLLIDWVTSGRRTGSAPWDFAECTTRNEIRLANRLILADALRLHPAEGPLRARLSNFHCLATVVLLGDRLQSAAHRLLEWVAAQPVEPNAPLIFSASPLANGLILRAAGPGAEPVARFLRQRLTIVSELLGEDPWQRKW